MRDRIVALGIIAVLLATPSRASAQTPGASMTVREFDAKPAGEQIDVILRLIDNIMRHLTSATDAQGNPKPAELRQNHMAMARFVDQLFFTEDKNGKVQANRETLSDMRAVFIQASVLRPEASVDQILTIFLNTEYRQRKR